MKTKEQTFIEIFENYTIEINSYIFPNIIHIHNLKNKRLISYYKTQSFGIECDVSRKLVWNKFRENHKMKDNEIQQFISEMLSKHFNIKNTVPLFI